MSEREAVFYFGKVRKDWRKVIFLENLQIVSTGEPRNSRLPFPKIRFNPANKKGEEVAYGCYDWLRERDGQEIGFRLHHLEDGTGVATFIIAIGSDVEIQHFPIDFSVPLSASTDS